MLYIAADGDLANFAVESLKQLNHSAGEADKSRVVVAVQFAIDAPGGQQIPRYIFNKKSNGSISDSLADYLNAPDNMTEQQALISFLQWVYAEPRCQAEKYALILWGHGPELLFQPPSTEQLNEPGGELQNGRSALYLTPQELRQALQEGVPKKNEKYELSVIGFDACSMSMFEVAYELRGLADFMVASQEEVPDLSFPYDTLVQKFREAKDPAVLCKDGVYDYVRAYQDYICDASTGMKPVTLSALRLAKCNDLRKALGSLARALCRVRRHPSLPGLLVKARMCSRDFAGGLYVDLYDFCAKLYRQICLSHSDERKPNARAAPSLWTDDIKAACVAVINAVREDSVGNPKGSLVLANSSADRACHGISIYFPYLSDQQYAQLHRPLVKGGPDTIGKGFSAVMNRAASNLLMCVRRQLIVDTESYYEHLRLSQDTCWYYFIAKLWSKILVDLAPEKLDVFYSAQQGAVNACKKLKPIASCPPCACTEEGKRSVAYTGGEAHARRAASAGRRR